MLTERELSTAKTYELISTDEKSVADKHFNERVTKFTVCITESKEKFPTFNWLPNFINDKARFIAISSSCTTTSLSKVSTSCLTAIKNHWIIYCEKNLRKGRNKLFLVYKELY